MSNIRTTSDLTAFLTGPGENVLALVRKSDGECIPMTVDGFPAWIRVYGDTLLVEQRYNCTYDEEIQAYIGGEMRILLELKLK